MLTRGLTKLIEGERKLLDDVGIDIVVLLDLDFSKRPLIVSIDRNRPPFTGAVEWFDEDYTAEAYWYIKGALTAAEAMEV